MARWDSCLSGHRGWGTPAPYGHAGAFDTLEGMVRHHLDTIGSLQSYDTSQAVMPSRNDLDLLDFVIVSDDASVASIAAANELAAIKLRESELQDLIEFLHALTDPSSIDLRGDIPASLPSGNTLAE